MQSFDHALAADAGPLEPAEPNAKVVLEPVP